MTGVPDDATITVVLPCLNEAGAIPWVLSQMPPGASALVADNGSTDDSAAVAEQFGARVIHVPQPGYGAACHAGIEAAGSDLVAVMDCDATLDPAQLQPLIGAVATGDVDMAVCRRRPASQSVWPWHARLGTGFLAWWLRRTTGLVIHDLAPVRVFRRGPYLELGITDRGFGYPMEVFARVAEAGWTVGEFDMEYRERIGESKVAGTVGGSVRATRALLRAAPRRRLR